MSSSVSGGKTSDTWIFRLRSMNPKAYTKPWTITESVHLLTNTGLLESVCNENNRDLDYLPGNQIK